MNVVMAIYTTVSKCVTTLMGHIIASALMVMNLTLTDFHVLVRNINQTSVLSDLI